MRRLMNDAGLPVPIFHTQGLLTVTFMKRVKIANATNDRLSDRLTDRLNSREKCVFLILSENPTLRTNQLSEMIDGSIPTLSRTI